MVCKWEEYLRVDSWNSFYVSVGKLLSHLDRIGKSEASRSQYCTILYDFCKFVRREKCPSFGGPDELVSIEKGKIEDLVQTFCDEKRDSPRYANTRMECLKTFFKYNGFKGIRQLEVEGYSLRSVGRKRPQYVPTLAEALRMADVAGSLKNRAIVLTLLSTGLRNSTLCAVLYGDIKNELESGQTNIHIKVYKGMKKIVPNACKDGIEYSAFTSPQGADAIRLYIRERLRKFTTINDSEPLFIPELGRLRSARRALKPMTSREVQVIVKEAGRRAGIREWADLTPHCLRKTYSTWILRAPLIDGSRLDFKIQEVFMGHKLKGSMEYYFDRSKIEEMRKEFSKLVFTPRSGEEISSQEVLQTVARVLGIDFLHLVESKKKELGRELNREESLHLLQETVREIMASNSRQTPCVDDERNKEQESRIKSPSDSLPTEAVPVQPSRGVFLHGSFKQAVLAFSHQSDERTLTSALQTESNTDGLKNGELKHNSRVSLFSTLGEKHSGKLNRDLRQFLQSFT